MVASLSLVSAVAAFADAGNTEELWDQFKLDYGRVYNSDAEEQERFEIFKATLDRIDDVNSQNLPYTYGINQFADVSADEMRRQYFGRKPRQPFKDTAYLGKHEPAQDEILADSIDWTDQGAVTGVKDQGSCGSCWAFGTTGSLEGRWFLHSGSLLSLSEQQLLDCDKQDDACDGGLEDSAIEYVSGAGICSESDYGYTARKGSCRSSSCSKAISAGGITGYKDVGQSASALMSAVMAGPVNLGVAAEGSFENYNSGVLTNCRSKDIDHAVLLVGYGSSPQDYWKVKNSWGTSWGERGYIRVTRSGDPCAILDETLYPVTSGGPTPTPTPTPPKPPPAPTPPKPPPAPTPTPTPSPSGDHYGRPPCLSDEDEMDFDDGVTCGPSSPCSSDDDCPMVPDDAYYYAECGIIGDDQGNDYCGIPCDRNSDCQSGASCKEGLCLYSFSSTGNSKKGFHINSKKREHVTV